MPPKPEGTRKAAVKLGILGPKTLVARFRHWRRMDEDEQVRIMEELRGENKRLRRELEEKRKDLAILKDAADFFAGRAEDEAPGGVP